MMHQPEKGSTREINAFEFEVLVRAAGTSNAYRQSEGVENLARKYSEHLGGHKHAMMAIRIILGAKVDAPSRESFNLAQDAIGASAKSPLTYESFTRAPASKRAVKANRSPLSK